MIEAAESLVPLHNAPALAGSRGTQELPRLLHVAVFDTAFHATLPAQAAVYAVPRQWREEWGVHRLSSVCRPCARGARGRALLAGAARSLDPE
jgi:acetate kinase